VCFLDKMTVYTKYVKHRDAPARARASESRRRAGVTFVDRRHSPFSRRSPDSIRSLCRSQRVRQEMKKKEPLRPLVHFDTALLDPPFPRNVGRLALGCIEADLDKRIVIGGICIDPPQARSRRRISIER